MSEPEHQPVAPGPAPGSAEDPPPPNGRVGFLYVMIFLSLTCSMAAVYMLWETRSRRTQMIGDGRDIDTYRFDLSGLTVSRASLKASRMPRDSFEPINARKVRDLAELRRLDEERPPGDYRREMVAKEVVVGVVVDGHARAYPLRILRWHEIVNDTLGDVPVAVTYDPLCDSIVVFDRRVGGETLSFGFSGLLHNSNLVLYDRRKQPVPHIELTDEQRKQPTDESLWSQLRFEVVAGPLVEGKHELRVLPMWIGLWEQWIKQQPGTTVMRGEQASMPRYKRNPYIEYYQAKKLWFGTDPPLPTAPPEGIDYFEPILAFQTSDGWKWIPERLAGEAAVPEGVPNVRCLWFAWYAVRGAGGRLSKPAG